MDGGNPCLPAGKFDPSCLKPLKTGTHTEAVLLKLIAEIYLHGSWTGCLTTSDVFKVSIYKLYIYQIYLMIIIFFFILYEALITILSHNCHNILSCFIQYNIFSIVSRCSDSGHSLRAF